jgi:hypothetical protein
MFNPDSYVVFTVESRVPGNNVTVKHEKEDLSNRTNAEIKLINVTKQKWASSPTYKDVIATISKYRGLIYDKSSPWGKGSGERIATKKMWLDEIEPLVMEAEQEIGSKVVTFVSEYDAVLKYAEANLGTLFDASDYPDKEEIKSNFYMLVGTAEAPDPSASVTFGSLEVERRFKERMEQKLQRNLKVITDEINEKVCKVVGRVAERLESYDIDWDGKVHNMFRDSLINNVQDLSEVLRYMNINDDPKIEKLRSDMVTKLTRYHPSELREDEDKRELVASDAKDILAGLSGLTRSIQ